MKKTLLCQFLLIVMSICMAVGAYRFVEAAKITSKTQSINDYRMLNQQVLTKIERLDSGSYFSAEQQARRAHLIHIINRKNQLPAILEMLASQKRTGQINRLLLDHQSVEINYSTADVQDKLSLFQLLNSYPSFCHVSFDAADFNPMKEISSTSDILNYVFKAKLCDIPAN